MEFPENKLKLSGGLLPFSLTLVASLLGPASDAFAKDGEFGILEGRTVAMIHPITMLILFGISVSTGYVGLQWRRLREIGNEIRFKIYALIVTH